MCCVTVRQEYTDLQRGTYLLSVQLTGGALDLVATSMVSPDSARKQEIQHTHCWFHLLCQNMNCMLTFPTINKQAGESTGQLRHTSCIEDIP